MDTAEIDRLAKIIWDYMHMNHALKKCEAIFALGSNDTGVAERAAQLYLDGYGDYLILSGGLGKLTKDRFTKPEAEVFADIALNMGVPKDKLILETASTNTGENIRLTYELLQKLNLSPRSLILVQKPYMERRTYATFKKQWPSPDTEILVTSPQIAYEDYPNEILPKNLVINIMVGDLQRIKEYPKLGYQVEQETPEEVWKAYEQLVEIGYNKHVV